jgi:hypothetical protein
MQQKSELPKAAKQIKRAKKLWHILIIYYMIYNTYFGWNTTPVNEYEQLCDMIAKIVFFIVAFSYFSPIFKYFENQAVVHGMVYEKYQDYSCDDPDCENCKSKKEH